MGVSKCRCVFEVFGVNDETPQLAKSASDSKNAGVVRCGVLPTQFSRNNAQPSGSFRSASPRERFSLYKRVLVTKASHSLLTCSFCGRALRLRQKALWGGNNKNQFCPILGMLCQPFRSPPFLIGLFYSLQTQNLGFCGELGYFMELPNQQTWILWMSLWNNTNIFRNLG